MITIRIALNTDIEEIQSLYRNTVLVINRRDYSQAEVEDWASCGDDPSKIEGMIKTHYFIVAVNRQSEIVGFSSTHFMAVRERSTAEIPVVVSTWSMDTVKAVEWLSVFTATI